MIAILDFPGKERLFMASALAMIFLPILLWVYIWLYGIYANKRTLATVWPEDEVIDHDEDLASEDNTEDSTED